MAQDYFARIEKAGRLLLRSTLGLRLRSRHDLSTREQVLRFCIQVDAPRIHPDVGVLNGGPVSGFSRVRQEVHDVVRLIVARQITLRGRLAALELRVLLEFGALDRVDLAAQREDQHHAGTPQRCPRRPARARRLRLFRKDWIPSNRADVSPLASSPVASRLADVIVRARDVSVAANSTLTRSVAFRLTSVWPSGAMDTSIEAALIDRALAPARARLDCPANAARCNVTPSGRNVMAMVSAAISG
jgi:hypothetical protein